MIEYLRFTTAQVCRLLPRSLRASETQKMRSRAVWSPLGP